MTTLLAHGVMTDNLRLRTARLRKCVQELLAMMRSTPRPEGAAQDE